MWVTIEVLQKTGGGGGLEGQDVVDFVLCGGLVSGAQNKGRGSRVRYSSTAQSPPQMCSLWVFGVGPPATSSPVHGS